MERAEVKEEILFELGYPTVKVEIDDTAWDAIFSRSLRWFKAKKGIIHCAQIPVTSGIREYDFPPDSYEIVEVILPVRDSSTALFNLCFFDVIPLGNFGVGGVGWHSGFRFESSSYAQLMQSLEMRRRVFSAEPGWIEQCGKILITMSNPPDGNMTVLFKADNIDIPDLKGRDEDLIFRYCLATAKMVLGRLLRKYGVYPAAGGPINTDGAELIADAKEEIEKLEEEIIGSQDNAGGIVVG